MDISLYDITFYSSIIGISVFSWSFYNYSGFRRKTIETAFNTYDYCYDKFHKIWYDDKIRTENIVKKDINVKHINNYFMINTNLENVGLEYFSNKLETIYESESESDYNSNSNSPTNSAYNSDSEEIKESKKIKLHKPERALIKFLTNDLKFEAVKIKEKKYYLLGPNPKFSHDNVLEMPWLSVSLEITSDSDDVNTHDITDTFNKFWLHGNHLPLHLEYYDFWIDTLLSESGISKNNIVSKDKIKQLKLSIINESGDFVEYNNVLIVPRKNNLKIIDFPLKDKT